MMVKIADHLDNLVQGLAIDMDRKKQETAARQRLETQLYRLLTEMVETERKYVRDLEQVRNIFTIKFEILSCCKASFENFSIPA